MLQWGKPETLRLLAKREKEGRGGSTPALKSRPSVPFHLITFWTAFNELHARRDRGFGPSPLKFSEIEAWFRLRGISGLENVNEYLEYIMALDERWVTHAAAESSRNRVKKTPRQKRANLGSSNQRDEGEAGGG